ncbi:MAG: hypothetical protein H7066_04495, partial [Cytophagaceae bacterium]|nr:hypothetical protein [Gemmatimonadaceae bacterium]
MELKMRAIQTIRSSVMAILIAAGVACGGSGEAAKGGDSATAAAGGADGTITIAMIAKSSTNPVFLAARTGADSAAKELSAQGIKVEVLWLTPPQ